MLNSDSHTLSPNLWLEIANLSVDNNPPRPGITRERLKPEISIPDDTKLRRSVNTLAYLFKTKVEIAPQRLLKREHTTWPKTFFVLSLLLLVHFDLAWAKEFTSMLCNVQNTLKLKSLASLYLHYCGHFLPSNTESLDED